MKVTIDWLKKYVDFDYTPNELAEKLTLLGLEVDSISEIKYDFENVIIGEIKSVKQHAQKPNLSICEVNIGSKSLNLVCGAPNVSPGIKVPVATVGARLPKDVVIKAATIHGIESPGMICSEAELGISHQSDVIMTLTNSASVGADLKSYLNKGETVIEMDITPNRPDCLGVIGVAREIAALKNAKVKKPDVDLNESNDLSINDFIDVEIKNPESCPRYTACYIQGIKVGPSPRWLIQKLEAVGLRTVNNVVDVTNFVMMETGQPLHAFDYDLLADHKIIVKHADPGEKFITLDEKEHKLSDERLMICDGKRSIALAGVMGGLNSEITHDTKNVLLESALFESINIRKTSKLLDITTDSSKRFERGVDPDGLVFALYRAAQLIQETAGGEVARGYFDCYPLKIEKRKIKLSIDRVNRLLGTKLNIDEAAGLLERLEFSTKKEKDYLLVDVPTFRVDIEREVDLIEEISRLYGFDKIDPKIEANIPLTLPVNMQEKFDQKVRDNIIRMGYNEILTHSMVSLDLAEQFSVNKPVSIKNPLSEEMGTLRTSIIPGALQIIKWNKNRKIKNQKVFEIGNIFYYDKAETHRHVEQRKVAFFRTGQNKADSWCEKARQSTFYDLKGDVISLIESLGISKTKVILTEVKYLKKNQAVNLFINNNPIGYLGALSDSALKIIDIEDDVFVAELDIDQLYQHFSWEKKANPVIKYPSIKRDLAIVLDHTIAEALVEEKIWEAGGNYLQSVEIFDVYRGKQVAANQKSFAFNLTFQSNERTLTETEVDGDLTKILKSLESQFNARLRS